jgi:hypothetical protein
MPEVQPPEPTPGNIRRDYEITDAELRHHSQELGLLGKIFGSRENAPINIAGMLMFLGLLGLITVPFLPQSASFSQGDMAKTLGAIVLAALTFLGGYLGGGKR